MEKEMKECVFALKTHLQLFEYFKQQKQKQRKKNIRIRQSI